MDDFDLFYYIIFYYIILYNFDLKQRLSRVCLKKNTGLLNGGGFSQQRKPEEIQRKVSKF